MDDKSEKAETFQRQMNQCFERNWNAATPEDRSEWWTMKNSREPIRLASINPDRIDKG